MSNKRTYSTRAFGVEPGYPPYRLRQARYQALGEDVARIAGEHRKRTGRPVELLDVGCGDGLSMRYIEPHEGGKHVRYHGVDLFPKGTDEVYKADKWRLKQIDLERGLPGMQSERYDIVLCEQVLEHLHHCEDTLRELVRVLRPGGALIVGVPIFVHGVHALRKFVVGGLERLGLRTKTERGHVQAFSKTSFSRLLRATGALSIEDVRGFRIVSGGPLRPLEYCRWWWQVNRRIGRAVPSLCVEIQVVARKHSRQAALRAAA